MCLYMQEEDSGSSKECVYYSFLLSAILEVLYIKLAPYFCESTFRFFVIFYSYIYVHMTQVIHLRSKFYHYLTTN